MRIITKEEKIRLMRLSSVVGEVSSQLMEIDDLKASAYNLSELEHYLEHTHKYLKRILEENKNG